MHSPEAVYYTWMISFALCFHFINFICTQWQWREIPSGTVNQSSLLAERGYFLDRGHAAHLVHSTVILIGESKLQSRNRGESKLLKGLQNEHQCIPVEKL